MAELSHSWCIITIHILLSIHTISALPSPPNPPSSDLTLPTRPPWSSCVDLPTWQQTHLDPADCFRALQLFRQQESEKVQTQRFEFISPGARARTGLLPLTTPRRYSIGTCTITLALLGSVPRPLLPPGTHTRGRWPGSDVATFEELVDAARGIYQECVTDLGRVRPSGPLAGWHTKGHVDGVLGVFVWQTGSRMDKTMRELYPDGDVRGGFANGTSTA
ncbi:MAG: hypothetical protein LQ350_008458 [Teloschistes chrysophthalmus]|nr:MAG: hypothetical protein LQ350_008458 [Niorma chrysophthalma]